MRTSKSSDQVPDAGRAEHALARGLGIALGLLALAALLWSFGLEAAPAPAPAYALASPVIWRLERAVAAIVLLSVPAIVIARLLIGHLPQRIGSEGVGWAPDPGSDPPGA